MPYILGLETAASRDFTKLERSLRARISEAMDGLTSNPRPHGCKKMVGTKRRYRVRIGDYRIIYEIYDESQRVVIKMIRHRGDAYR
jgi:mRNA interferase RelE/StbE